MDVGGASTAASAVASDTTRLYSTSNQQLGGVFLTKMVFLMNSFWFWITTSMVICISFLTRYVFRIRIADGVQKAKDSQGVDQIAEVDELHMRNYDPIEKTEDETPIFRFKFEYQIPEGGRESRKEPEVYVAEKDELPTAASVHQYRFLSEKDFSGFIEEPEAMTVCVQESYIEPEVESLQQEIKKFDTAFLSAKETLLPSEESDTRNVQPSPDGYSFRSVHELDESKDLMPDKFKVVKKGKGINCETNLSDESEVIGRMRFLSEEFSGFDTDSESSFSDGYSVKDLVVDSDSDCFMSDKDFIKFELESDTTEASMNLTRYKMELIEDIRQMEEARLQSLYNSDTESADSRNHFMYINNKISSPGSYYDEIWSENDTSENVPEEQILKSGDEQKEVQELQETNMTSTRSLQIELTDFSNDDELNNIKKDTSTNEDESVIDPPKSEHRHEDLEGKNNKENTEVVQDVNLVNSTDDLLRSIDNSEQEDASLQVKDSVDGNKALENDIKKPQDKGWKDLDDDDDDGLESLWEHQELIEQLKMELKKVRAIGLPTIMEESESPKTIEDLKPWKIEDKFLREDPMDELHKFYKSYRERMRKLDILSYQKMYAMGVLQVKDPLKSMSSQKPLPTITSILSQIFLPRRRRSTDDPSEKFIREELRCDLEMVYVGQTCLSWEFLRWQYEKALEMPESDPYRSHRYNQVAGKFQQFQVILQRFIENESFQGPRLPNYVKNRCVLRNLLQVPDIKEDCLKDKMEEQRKGAIAIMSEDLEDIMEESIRIFWEFVKADKDETPGLLKGLMASQVELEKPTDYQFMMHIQSILQKKDKKLKDLLRTGNCLVKKFKKPKEDRSNQDLFFSQVDMKLVSRVLKMPRITSDQLLWCHKKLSKIVFAYRKVHREPSFLLFPC